MEGAVSPAGQTSVVSAAHWAGELGVGERTAREDRPEEREIARLGSL